MKNLVILGGGYGGMGVLSRLLSKKLPNEQQITLIDVNPYHSLKIKNYSVAAGTAKEKDIQSPFPKHPQLKVVQGKVEQIDLEQKVVTLENGNFFYYDDLIIGLGCEDNFEEVPGAKEHAYSVQTYHHAKRTYDAIKELPEGATVSIIGGGLTGVELASELYETYPYLNIKIFDRNNHILSTFPEKVYTYVENWFDNHQIDINTNANVTRVEKNVIYIHQQLVETDITIWAAGIRPNRVVRNLNVEKDRKGRVLLTPYHNIPGNEHVYVVGDCASLAYSPSAQLAEGQGEQIADILLKRWKGEPLPEKMPPIKLKGVLVALGKRDGLGLLADRTITGKVPRLLKSGIMWMYKYHNS